LVDVLFLLIPLSLVLLCVIVWALMWAIRNRQFDDLEGPMFRVLMDEDEGESPHKSASKGESER